MAHKALHTMVLSTSSVCLLLPSCLAFQHPRTLCRYPPCQATAALQAFALPSSLFWQFFLPSSPGPSLTHQLALGFWLFQNVFCRLVYELVKLYQTVVTYHPQSPWLNTSLLFDQSKFASGLCHSLGKLPSVTCWWRLHHPMIVPSRTLGFSGWWGRRTEYWQHHVGI